MVHNGGQTPTSSGILPDRFLAISHGKGAGTTFLHRLVTQVLLWLNVQANLEQVPVTGHSTRVALTYSQSNSCNGRESKADFYSIFAEYDRTFVSSYFDELVPSHVNAVHVVDRFAPMRSHDALQMKMQRAFTVSLRANYQPVQFLITRTVARTLTTRCCAEQRHFCSPAHCGSNRSHAGAQRGERAASFRQH